MNVYVYHISLYFFIYVTFLFFILLLTCNFIIGSFMILSICEMANSFIIHPTLETVIHWVSMQGWKNTLMEDGKRASPQARDTWRVERGWLAHNLLLGRKTLYNWHPSYLATLLSLWHSSYPTTCYPCWPPLFGQTFVRPYFYPTNHIMFGWVVVQTVAHMSN